MNPFKLNLSLTYNAHVSNIGWMSSLKNGSIAGSTGRNLPLEALQLHLSTNSLGNVLARAHVRSIGWQNWTESGKQIGTTGRALPIEALQFKLTNILEKKFDIYYRAHIQNVGWLGWAKNGSNAGTSNYNYHIEAIQVAIQRKNLGFGGYNGQGSYRDKNLRKVIFIDPGHGGDDPGATSYTGLREKDVTLSISKMVRDKLLQYGNKYEVIMSRTDDIYVDFKKERSEMSNRANADIFVSVHVNSGGGGSAKGVEVYWYEYDSAYQPVVNQKYHNDPIRLRNSERLANSIQNNIIKSTGAVNRGVRRATYAVVREAKAPAVLIETGYIDNSSEVYKLASKQYQEKIANGIVNGIIEYFNK
ncbi:N-acetylmuramoyl-L-alanine amidase [Enterococcus cecorum]|uniref:N-acetylmuramoyl-L-alanine amidase n=1 Tax=Enterococcus cecorum TaxID=44008 RepID=UPI003431503D